MKPSASASSNIEELYLTAFKTARAIPHLAERFKSKFQYQDFRKRFFYMFIERMHDYTDKEFNENLFDIGEKNYSISMVKAFIHLFKAVGRNEELSVKLIDELHNIAVARIPGFEIGYRGEDDLTTDINDMIKASESSKNYFQEIAQDGGKIKLHFIGSKAIGYYERFSTSFRSNPFGFHQIYDSTSAKETVETMKHLVQNYNNKMKLTTDKKKEHHGNILKLELIASLIKDLNLLHPYKDGNSRTISFLLLNFLLLKEKLSPCIIITPNHAEALTVDEIVISISEGQEAFRKYFIEGVVIDNLRKPVTEELHKVMIYYNPQQISAAIHNLFDNYLDLIEAEKSPDKNKKFICESLREAISILKQNNIDSLKPFSLPLSVNEIFHQLLTKIPKREAKMVSESKRKFEDFYMEESEDRREILEIHNKLFKPQESLYQAFKEVSNILDKIKDGKDLNNFIEIISAKYLSDTTNSPALVSSKAIFTIDSISQNK